VTADHPVRRHLPAYLDHSPIGVKEDKVKIEPHPERVDAPAGANQEAIACVCSVEESQPKEACDAGSGDRHLEAEHAGHRQVAKPLHSSLSTSWSALAPSRVTPEPSIR
jgi:hypothetical protein